MIAFHKPYMLLIKIALVGLAGFSLSCKKANQDNQVKKTITEQLEQQEVFEFSANLIEQEEPYPMSLSLEIYHAKKLPIGEHYQDVDQLKEATKIGTLNFDINVDSQCTVKDSNIQGKTYSQIQNHLDLLYIDIEMKLIAIGGMSIQHHFMTNFQQQTIYETGIEGGDTIVCVYKVRKLGWVKREADPQTARNIEEEKNTSTIVHDPFDEGYIPFTLPQKAQLAPSHGGFNQKDETTRKAEASKVKLRSYRLAEIEESITPLSSCPHIPYNASVLNAKPTDKLIDLRPIFKELITSTDQWVYYNQTKHRVERSDSLCNPIQLFSLAEGQPQRLKATNHKYPILSVLLCFYYVL